MTDDLYTTRLRFSGRHGIAKMHNVTISLATGPNLGDGPVWFVDYRPECGFALVQPRPIDTVRDMTKFEIAAADAFLRRLITSMNENAN